MPDVNGYSTVNEVIHKWLIDDVDHFLHDFWCAVPPEQFQEFNGSTASFIWQGFVPEDCWEFEIKGKIFGVDYVFKTQGIEEYLTVMPDEFKDNPEKTIKDIVKWVELNIIKHCKTKKQA